MLKKLFLALCSVVLISNVASAQTTNVCHGRVVSIESLGRVLYKPSNLHGGRGPSFLVQNEAERTNKKVLKIRNARCEPIASIGLYATDQPFGSRYYMRSGGSGEDADALYALATKVGSPNILIEGVGGKWIRIQDPRLREGAVQK